MKYTPTIGLEIHVELKTQTKMFCNSLNNPDEKRPNVNVCPICMAHPGTLPVINKEAVKKVLIVGKALNGKLADYSCFDRKNYFYPDLPKGYQISQFKHPLVKGGKLNGIKITRIHLEEDTGKLIHTKEGSLVDFNRAGVPLMELVTEPDIKSGEEAGKFAEELQLILRYLDVSDADMEKGEMRVEANISLQTTYDVGKANDIVSRLLGTKVEIKNLNSFRAVERAINYEIERQSELLNEGKKIVHETRGWNENKEITFSQREKEKSHDYRYFPEPDLPYLQISNLKSQISNLPELPNEKRERFKKEYEIKDEQIKILVRDKKLADYFEKVCLEIESPNKIQLAANYLITDLAGDLTIVPENFAELINMIAKGEITSRVAKDVLREMREKGGSPSVII
ncbi:Asp-tRNA(Asn)/Glu-tRNA(Gln) amidotransferase subunit GatB, partial [Patescibacteria group bacterium]|nr:Asp-tRNA(Asn)/Glu-tRNA(Gln) amidotransferase subunit GatB [Patescibacteria group bacterium]